MSPDPFASLNLGAHVGDDPESVLANRARAAGLLGLGGDDLAVLTAEHGAGVVVVTEPGPLPPGDAAVTTRAGIGLVALAADCVPLAVASTAGTPVVGVVHCGWRGLAAGVVDAAIDTMEAMGGRGLQAVLGPSVCARCYPVGADRIEEVRACVGAAVSDAATWLAGSIDVAAGVRAQLEARGVPSMTCAGCTVEEPSLFSFRRDGRTGRQGVIICL